MGTANKKSKTWDDVAVRHSVLTTSGQPIHLCNDGEWRTDSDLQEVEITEPTGD